MGIFPVFKNIVIQNNNGNCANPYTVKKTSGESKNVCCSNTSHYVTN